MAEVGLVMSASMHARAIEIRVFEMDHPRDMVGLDKAIDCGEIVPENVVAVVGKTYGTGRADDAFRRSTEACIIQSLRAGSGATPDEIRTRVRFVLSSGAVGVIVPHIAVISRREQNGSAGGAKRLAVGVAETEPLMPSEVGTEAHVQKVAAAVRTALSDSGIGLTRDVHCVLVRTAAHVDEVPSAVDAAALGVAVGLGEIGDHVVTDDDIRSRWDLYSSVAWVTAGGGRPSAEVVLLGNSDASTSQLVIGHGTTIDALDLEGIKEALRSAGLKFACCPAAEDLERVILAIGKLSVPESGLLRGQQTTLTEDQDGTRIIKACGGSLLGSVVGTGRVLVSGGFNTHQGPPGMSPVAAVIAV